MAESKLLADVYTLLTSNFTSGWIDAYDWKEVPACKNSLSQGRMRINEARQLIFTNFSKFALGGKQFVETYNTLDKISEWALEDVVVNAAKKYKAALQNEYRDFIFDIQDSVKLLRYHIDITFEQFSSAHQNNYFNAIKRARPSDQQGHYVNLLETIIDICWAEYRFSFNDSFIQNLLQLREDLKDATIIPNKEVGNIISTAIKKVELMLCKLAVFSKDKVISYNYNFHQYTISWDSIVKDAKDKFHSPFLKFIEPEHLSNNDIEELQKDSLKQDIAMWRLVLLMRYYSNTTKNLVQINKVVEINNKHYEESIAEPDNVINHYAARSVKNYMYNCRLSYLCQYNKEYTIAELRKDLEEIEAIQNETFIKNYHPYQKAYLFIKEKIEEGLNKMRPQDELESELELLKACFNKFKENVKWCQSFQPYIYQLRFNYCTDKWNDIEVFCPSSYCRPLRFKELYECINQYTNELWSIEHKIKNNPDRLRILSAHEEIANIEKKNYELLSFFSTVVIFLVGLISIFIGNTASMKDKLEYVIVLGSILLLFVCLGYFIAGRRFDEHKPKIFGIMAIILLLILGHYYFFWLPKQYTVNEEKPRTEQADQIHPVEAPQLNSSK